MKRINLYWVNELKHIFETLELKTIFYNIYVINNFFKFEKSGTESCDHSSWTTLVFNRQKPITPITMYKYALKYILTKVKCKS